MWIDSGDTRPKPGIVEAPWTEEQVRNLNAFQVCGFLHPFTCPQCDGGLPLAATPEGWVCVTEACDYTQNWAHGFMADGSALQAGAHALEGLLASAA